jgi:Putative prokaryotic signal transducing protein
VPSEAEATMVRSLLESAGIESTQRSTPFGAGAALGSMSGPVEILVRADDLDTARELLDAT